MTYECLQQYWWFLVSLLGALLVFLMFVRAAAPKTVGVVLNTNTKKGNVILGDKYRTLWGQDFLMDTLCGLRFKLSVPSFYQVNRDQAEVLYGKALEFAGLTGEETVLDLYCGTGTITLYMAAKAKKVIGAEIVAPAIADARENAERNGIVKHGAALHDAEVELTSTLGQGTSVKLSFAG